MSNTEDLVRKLRSSKLKPLKNHEPEKTERSAQDGQEMRETEQGEEIEISVVIEADADGLGNRQNTLSSLSRKLSQRPSHSMHFQSRFQLQPTQEQSKQQSRQKVASAQPLRQYQSPPKIQPAESHRMLAEANESSKASKVSKESLPSQPER